MVLEFEINIDGEVPEGELQGRLQILGELILSEVRNKIRKYDLIDSGDYLREWLVTVNGTTLVFEHAKEYAWYLEFGTYDWWDEYGLDSFPDKAPKKKDLPPDVAASLPKGMAPFAPLRRTLYDDDFMVSVVGQAFGARVA